MIHPLRFVYGEKKTLTKVSELYKMQCPFQLLVKAYECLKPLGNFELSWQKMFAVKPGSFFVKHPEFLNLKAWNETEVVSIDRERSARYGFLNGQNCCF